MPADLVLWEVELGPGSPQETGITHVASSVTHPDTTIFMWHLLTEVTKQPRK